MWMSSKLANLLNIRLQVSRQIKFAHNASYLYSDFWGANTLQCNFDLKMDYPTKLKSQQPHMKNISDNQHEFV